MQYDSNTPAHSLSLRYRIMQASSYRVRDETCHYCKHYTQLVETCSRSYPELSVQTELSSRKKMESGMYPMNFPCFAKSLVCCQRLRHDWWTWSWKDCPSWFILKLRNKKNHQDQDQRIHGFNFYYSTASFFPKGPYNLLHTLQCCLRIIGYMFIRMSNIFTKY